ncbi:L-carnitine/gamma-butyrobetaine antiporter [Achromobacter dolens]|nr:L-carnitine/gamma-butyrobetaine antiporter [Achromobacter dolens]
MSSETRPSTINRPVFYTAALFTLLLVGFAIATPRTAQNLFESIQGWILGNASWFYILVVAIILLSVAFLAISRYGDIKLGPDHSEPDYRNFTWFAMLFSAGMGIGLMFFGVAEPVMHFMSPPVGEGATAAAARESMKITFFHWGLHAWAIYAVVALTLAFFSFRHGLPLTLRSALYPLIANRIHGPIGHAVDIFAIIGTVLGVATSLGLGVAQMNSGLNHLFGIPVGVMPQIILIVITCGLATLSVASGLDKGIRILSEANMVLAVILLLFVLVAGPTVFLLQTFVQNTGAYLSDIVNKTFNLYAYEPTDWIGGWTLFYWGWWIAWSPFVGLFIARISRGRTIREFVSGVLLVPAGFTLFWMTVFGDTAIHFILVDGIKGFADTVKDDNSLALFAFFELLPWSGVISIFAIAMVAVFFVTSADSGALVVDLLASGGRRPHARVAAHLLVAVDGRGGHCAAAGRRPDGAADGHHRQRAAVLGHPAAVAVGVVQGAQARRHQARHPLPVADPVAPGARRPVVGTAAAQHGHDAAPRPCAALYRGRGDSGPGRRGR